MRNVCRWYGGLRATMIYLHATRDRDQAIVKALGTFVRDARDVTGEIAIGGFTRMSAMPSALSTGRARTPTVLAQV